MKKLLLLMLVIALLLPAGCSSNSNDESETGEGSTENQQSAPELEEYYIRVGLVTPEQDIATRSMRHFEEQVELLSDGQIEVELFIGGALGGSADIINGVQDGSIEMCVNIYPTFAQFSDAFYLYNLPYLFSSKEIAFEFLDSDLGQSIAERIEANGFKQLAVFDGGFRNISNNIRPIKHPDDLDGLRIRTLDNPIQIDYFAGYGANPTPLPYGDIYVGLQTRTIDGQENSFSNTATMRFNEVQEYMTDTQHGFDPAGMFMNTSVYESYPDEVKEILHEAALSTQEFNRELAVELEKQAIEEIKETTELTLLSDEERQVFAEKAQPTYDNFRDVIGAELLEEALSKIAELENR